METLEEETTSKSFVLNVRLIQYVSIIGLETLMRKFPLSLIFLHHYVVQLIFSILFSILSLFIIKAYNVSFFIGNK